MRAKATSDDGGDLPCEGREWGKIRPAGTISREVMRAGQQSKRSLPSITIKQSFLSWAVRSFTPGMFYSISMGILLI
jgi:hypothetical protein